AAVKHGQGAERPGARLRQAVGQLEVIISSALRCALAPLSRLQDCKIHLGNARASTGPTPPCEEGANRKRPGPSGPARNATLRTTPVKRTGLVGRAGAVAWLHGSGGCG